MVLVFSGVCVSFTLYVAFLMDYEIDHCLLFSVFSSCILLHELSHIMYCRMGVKRVYHWREPQGVYSKKIVMIAMASCFIVKTISAHQDLDLLVSVIQ